MEKHVDEAWEFVEKQALVIEKYSHRKSEGRKAGAYEVSEVTMSNFKLDAINNELKSLRELCATTLKNQASPQVQVQANLSSKEEDVNYMERGN